MTFYRLEFLDSVASPMKEILSQIMGTETSVRFVYEATRQNGWSVSTQLFTKDLQKSLSPQQKAFAEEVPALRWQVLTVMIYALFLMKPIRGFSVLRGSKEP